MKSFFVKFFGFLFDNTRLSVIFCLHFFSLTLYVGKYMFVSQLCWKIHVCIAYKTYAAEKLTDLLHLQLITCTMQVSEFENKNSYLGVVKFKIEDQKFLKRLLIFTPIPLNSQDVWSLNQFSRRE